MHSATHRLGSILSFSGSLILLLALLTALTSFFLTREPAKIALSLNSVNLKQGKEGHYKIRTTDLIDLVASLEADFSPLFNWNVKEVFAFLVVEYESTKGSRVLKNELTLWDRVIVSRNLGRHLARINSLRFATLKHRFVISNLANKYPVADINNLFKNKDAIKELKLTLKWTTFPWMGMIFHKTSGETSTTFCLQQ